MTTFFGSFFLWICLLFSILQFISSKRKKTKSNLQLTSLAAHGLLFFSTLSFLLLIYSYVISDFSVKNVFENSHTTKPLIYKISASWGNHEGSMLLWILVLNIFNYFLFRFNDKTDSSFIPKALETQAFIIIGFLLFTLLTSNPFERVDFNPANGLGFNPILQDPALAIHPPLLYIGYVGLSASFSLSIATLRLENEKVSWHKYMKPFVTASWTFLTIGIAFGSIWAYYELGWGGWWFWDPVENASFMPWLIGTALLHSLITVEKKKSLQSWVLFLAIIAFLLSLIGTFLVRSGILTSVHTFALDPSRGIYILIFLSLLGMYSLILFGLKSKKYMDNYNFSIFGRESAILVNNILMVIVCATVFLGTIYPLIIEALTSNKISVGEPYYNSTVIPIMIPAILVMGIGPILSWGKQDKIKIFKKIFPSIILTILLSFIIFILYKSYSFMGIVGILLAFWIITNNSITLLKKNKHLSKGMVIAHLGVGFLILGITGSSIWQKEIITKMNINNVVKINEYNVSFDKIDEIEKENYVAIQAKFLVYDSGNNFITKLKPENRYYPITNSFTTEASINTNLLRDLYIVLGDGNLNDGWTVRIYYNPLVIWIWIGAFIIFFGGIISTVENLKKIKKI